MHWSHRKTIFMILLLFMVKGSLSFCVINEGCRAIHAEIWDRRAQEADLFNLFPKGFKTDLKTTGQKQCCDPSSAGCGYPKDNTNDEVFLWMDCGNGGQTVVACQLCNVIVNESNMILVRDEKGSQGIRSMTACRA